MGGVGVLFFSLKHKIFYALKLIFLLQLFLPGIKKKVMGTHTCFDSEVETLGLAILMKIKKDGGKSFSFCCFSSLRELKFVGFLNST